MFIVNMGQRMGKDSGILILGVLLLALGALLFFTGLNGESISFASYYSGTDRKGSPGISIFMGLCMIIGGAYFIYESGYFRGKR